MIHLPRYTVNFFLMKEFNSSILKFLKLRGYNPPLQNIIKSSDLFERLSEQNMSDIARQQIEILLVFGNELEVNLTPLRFVD